MSRLLRDDDRIMSLVESALARPQAERLAWLAEACGSDLDLLTLAREYLVWEEQMDGFLLDPVIRATEPERPFSPGDLLESRFRIVREVAEGGMGIVYEAHDERLDRRVALKAAKAGFHPRLPPEVLHAGKISHPNVCKIFEIHTASTPNGDVDFVTMEFLDGSTLSEILKKGKPEKGEARRIALQICAGLAEAHRRQVIHGDLKTGNVLITEEPGGGTRAVITDFGLARNPAELRPAGPVAGTPSYMAPELFEGAKPAIASDIYALGVLLRELGTDRTAGPGWERVVERCTHPDPAQRFESATAVAEALTPAKRPWITGLAALALAAISGLTTWHIASAPAEQIRLAVLPLEADDSLVPLARRLHSEIPARIGDVRPSPHPGLEVVGPRDATHVLRTTLTQHDGGGIDLRVSLDDTATHAHRTQWRATYTSDGVRFIPIALAGVVAASFRLPAIVQHAEVNAAARQHYLSGLTLLQRNSTVEAALPHLERAVAADPDSALTHAGLAEARNWKYFLTRDKRWSALALESFRNAELRNPDLPEVRRISGWIKSDAGKYDAAVAELERAVALDPTSGDAYRRLGSVLERSNRLDEAYAALRRAIEVDGRNYRNHQQMATWLARRARNTEALESYRRAVELAPNESVARFALGRGYLTLGKFAEAEAELRQALLYGETPEALNTLGAVLTYTGKDSEAADCYERALRVYGDTWLWRMNLGTACRRMKLTTRAERAYREALSLANAELSRDPRQGLVRAGVAYISARLGDRDRAVTEIEQALQLTPDTETRRLAAQTWEALGRREDTLAVLRTSPHDVLADLARYPDMAGLCADPRFQELLNAPH